MKIGKLVKLARQFSGEQMSMDEIQELLASVGVEVAYAPVQKDQAPDELVKLAQAARPCCATLYRITAKAEALEVSAVVVVRQSPILGSEPDKPKILVAPGQS